MDSTAGGWPIDDLIKRARVLCDDAQTFTENGALDLLEPFAKRIIKDYGEAVSYLALAVEKMRAEMGPALDPGGKDDVH